MQIRRSCSNLKIKRVNALNFQEFSGFLIFSGKIQEFSGIFMNFWELSGDLRIFSEFLGVFRIF
jgi:hypothetical protein